MPSRGTHSRALYVSGAEPEAEDWRRRPGARVRDGFVGSKGRDALDAEIGVMGERNIKDGAAWFTIWPLSLARGGDLNS